VEENIKLNVDPIAKQKD